MADPSLFKLFRTVDPSTVNVQIKEKFAKLTLSSNKKKENKKAEELNIHKNTNSTASRQLLSELNSVNRESEEVPLQRSDSSSSSIAMGVQQTPKASQDELSQHDASEYMEVLQLSADGCTQEQTQDVDVEGLSVQVSNLTMEPKPRQPEVSICISSTTEERQSDEESCITISDTSVSDGEPEAQAKEKSPEEQDATMAVSEQLNPVVPLSNDKVQRIEAFLRDVSFERHEMIRRGIEDDAGEFRNSRLESADTESMSEDVDSTRMSSPPCTPSRIWCEPSSRQERDHSKRLADDETEVNTVCSLDQDSSKRLADNETEANTVCSSEPVEQDSSRRLADNETEANTVCSSEPVEQDSSRRLADNETEVNTPDLEASLTDVDPNESVVIPETSCEPDPETSPVRPSSASSVETADNELCTPVVQVSSINISAKINIKINIPSIDMDSSLSVSDAPDPDETCNDSPQSQKSQQNEHREQQQQQQRQEEEKSTSLLVDEGVQDKDFLTNAEKLLNELYGKSWQTPDIIRTLKRTGSQGSKAATRNPAPATPTSATFRTPLTEVKRQPRARQAAATTVKKRAPAAVSNESALGDFSLFKRALHSNKLNSTHLPTAARTDKGPSRIRPRTNHVDEERWRALIDSDSGADASDDDDADATDGDSDSGGSGESNDGNVTYLDLTEREIRVVESPNDKGKTKSPEFPKRLDDILRTCRAKDKPKMVTTRSLAKKIQPPTTPTTPTTENPTRRQLFVPNTGYEDESTARQIVDQAVEMDTLEDLENVYMPGTTVHKRVQEVKRQLGIAVESPKSRPIFPLPRTESPATSSGRSNRKAKTKPPPAVKQNGVCSFLKSLEGSVDPKDCDPEALNYRQNFAKKKEELVQRLYEMFNQTVFDNKLDVQVVWSKRLRNTAGRCLNKTRMRVRSSVIELSDKVLTSADRLRCTLIHEMCHAATWLFNGEGGHGRVWKNWAKHANNKFPDLPPISVCHNYAIEFKYTYKCVGCGRTSNAHSKSRKPENLRCNNCRGRIILLLNKKDKLGNIVPTPVREATGFAKFVKDNFTKYKQSNLKAAEVMRILGAEYAKLKGAGESSEEEKAQAISRLLDNVETLTIDDDS